MNRALLIIFILLTLTSCSEDSERIEKVDSEKIGNVKLHYNNGQVFCTGKHKGSGDEKIRIGNWNFFHPNGQLHMILNYDEIGEVIGDKEYSEKGIIIYDRKIIDNISTVSFYHPNGKLRTEEISKEIIEEDEDGEYSYFEINRKDYYENGVLKSQKLNDELIVWDSIGNELISVKYHDGIIITDTSNSK